MLILKTRSTLNGWNPKREVSYPKSASRILERQKFNNARKNKNKSQKIIKIYNFQKNNIAGVGFMIQEHIERGCIIQEPIERGCIIEINSNQLTYY